MAGDGLEPLAVARAVEEHRRYWRPRRVNVVLLAESHALTTDDELSVRIDRDRLPAGCPNRFVRFVYCLGYGEQELLRRPIPNNGGTWQYWRLLYSCLHQIRTPDDFAPILKTRTAFADRLAAKVQLLEELRDRGVWLVDASISAVYLRRGKRLKRAGDVILRSWDAYVEDVIRVAAPKFVICIGTGLAELLSDRLDRLVGSRRLSIIIQPQARASREAHMRSFRTCWEICEKFAR